MATVIPRETAYLEKFLAPKDILSIFSCAKVNKITITKEIAIIKKETNAVIQVRIILPNCVVSKFLNIISSGSGAKETDSPFCFSHLFLLCLLRKQQQK